MAKQSVSIAIAGYGGTGVITTGQLLIKTAAQSGYFGLAQRSFGAQIRGGESLSLLRLGTNQVLNPDDVLDILVLLDTEHVTRFQAEVPLNKNSVVLIAPKNVTTPAFVAESGATIISIPLIDVAPSGENIAAAGMLANYLGFNLTLLQSVVEKHFAKKSELLSSAKDWLLAGWDVATQNQLSVDLKLADNHKSNTPQLLINGSNALGLGVLKAGIRFVAAYPITPASGVLEWIAPNIEKLGGSLVQAEDELASINMIIGASFGGVPSLTATSGPGLALMSESIGLAVASETPLVILNVMRGGPSTGIPTKSEQSDLNIALHGLHGDAPHVVTAALSIADCAFTSGWSVWLAEHLQVPVISLSDQFMAQSDAAIAEPEFWAEKAQRLEAAHSDTPYHRYALTESGISPMAIPGEEGMEYTADGLEHNEFGTPSAALEHHHSQLAKRAKKLSGFDYGKYWAEIEGEGDTAIVCWGSVSSVAEEAAIRLTEVGQPCKVIALRLLAPLQIDKLIAELSGVKKILIVEQSHGAQFLAWLRSHINFSAELHSLAIPGPSPIRPSDIVNAISNWDESLEEQEHVANC